MIARRLGFADLNRLFTGEYASSRAQEAFEAGEHFLLRPFLTTICPLIAAQEHGDDRKIINRLRLRETASKPPCFYAFAEAALFLPDAVGRAERFAVLSEERAPERPAAGQV